MTSLEIVSFKKTIEDYIEVQKMPKVVIAMVLKEISAKAERDAMEETLREAKENEDVRTNN